MVTCAVVGASGYSGAELAALLAGHPQVRLAGLYADASAGQRFEDLHPGKRHLVTGELLAFDPATFPSVDVAFLALPHGASARAAAQIAGRAGRVIDLSGDLRLPDAGAYRRWYGAEHPAPDLLGRAAYGLPELAGRSLTDATLVACAGCYATASQLAAAPGVRAGGGDAGITIAAMSGTSGAGRKADLSLSFSEVGGTLRAYRVGRHQHAPEIAAGLSRLAGRPVTVTFVPHLVPIVRGILVSVVMPNDMGWTQARALEAHRAFYAQSPFVRIVDPARRLPEVTDVVGTNFCDIAPVVDEAAGTVVVIAVIDNLIKGAAGQAVQVMNVVLGLPETAGLLPAVREGA